jgi:uncharacterized protein YfaS (alpha-2-macroglobulin family)
MSRFLPAVKVAQTLRALEIEHKALEKRLPKCVQGGIKRLLQLQRPDGGWGWHGNGRTHEMMTPYALYGLMEAEKAGYELGSEGAVKKGMARLKQFIRSMGEKQAADRIYCMYVYAHRHGLDAGWWTFIREQLKKNRLSDYALAMALETAVRRKQKGLADDLAKALRARAVKSGSRVLWKTANFSRWGNDPHEITAAAFKALVAYDVSDPLIPGILSYFTSTKRGKRWNSTKDTAMIVFATCDYLAKKGIREPAKQFPTFAVNNTAAREVAFTGKLMTTVTLPATALRHGWNTIRFPKTAPGAMYRLVLRYRHAAKEIAPEAHGITVVRRYWLLDGKGARVREIKAGAKVPRGAYIESELTASNQVHGIMRYVLASNPKPSCCEILPATDKRFRKTSTAYALREDKTAGVLYHHEQTGAGLADRCVLHAELAGEYVVPPASVELMYDTETRGHSGTFRFTVVDS